MIKPLLYIGAIAPISVIPIVVSCSNNSKTSNEIARENKILKDVDSLQTLTSQNPSINRIDFDFKFMHTYGISEWWLRNNADGTWKNSFRSVAIEAWERFGFNITAWSDSELDAFIKSAPSDLHEIDPKTNMKYSDVLGMHMSAPLEFWIDKIKSFLVEMENHTVTILQDGNKIELRETFDKSSPIVKEIIL